MDHMVEMILLLYLIFSAFLSLSKYSVDFKICHKLIFFFIMASSGHVHCLRRSHGGGVYDAMLSCISSCYHLLTHHWVFRFIHCHRVDSPLSLLCLDVLHADSLLSPLYACFHFPYAWSAPRLCQPSHGPTTWGTTMISQHDIVSHTASQQR